MPSIFAQQLIEQVGPVDGYLHIDPVQLRTPTTVTSNKFAVVSKYEPWNFDTTKSLLAHHQVAVWRNLTAHIASREGVYGRMCTLYAGWLPHGAAAPVTVRDMASLKGSFSRTIGGTGDPGMFSLSIPVPFDGAMSDVLKTPYNIATRAVFYFAFVEVKLTQDPPDADRFVITFDGHYDVYGRY